MTFDPKQRFISFVPGGNGIIYGIQSDGTLMWYRHTGWTNGAATWANGGNGLAIGSQWQQFTTVLASNDGTLFGLRPDGTLHWYKYIVSNLNTGAGSWHPNSGAQIGFGFDVYARIIGGWNGVLFCIDDAGVMHWYRYAGTNGSVTWGANTGMVIGSGWNEISWLWADPNGVIYGWQNSTTLLWWRYVISNLNTGAGAWANYGFGIQLSYGWGENTQKTLFSNTNGTIYAVALDQDTVPVNDDELVWYKLLNSEHIDTAGIAWASEEPMGVGTGFTIQQSAALQGYASTLSTPPGTSVGIKVSTTWPTYQATVSRYAPAASGPVTMIPAASHTGRLQLLPTTYRSTGCAWSDDFTVTIPSTWQSGVYIAQLKSSFGNLHEVMFVVRPAAPKQKIAVVLPTNTYNAYNSWGGHFQYSIGQDTTQRQITLNRPSLMHSPRPNGYVNQALFSDLMLTTWMTSQGIGFDCYTDGDLDLTGSAWLPSYKAVVLCGHPEYFTEGARTALVNYLGLGGRLVYTGGNGIYEKVTYTPDRTAIVYRTPTGERNLFGDLGEPADQVIGVDYVVETYMDFFPYQVMNDHPFLAGTGLSVGDTFGDNAYDGAASGWEVDASPGGIPGQVIIASGQNPFGGADMTYLPKAGGGWVFTSGSMAFNGALPVDSAIQQIMANVFAAAVA